MQQPFSLLDGQTGIVVAGESDAQPELAEGAKADDAFIRHHQLPAGLPLHYGDLFGEQQRLAEAEGVTVLPYGVVEVAGSQRAEWLTKLASQRFDDLSPVNVENPAVPEFTGTSWRHALWLDPMGRIVAMAWGMEVGQRILLITERPQDLLKHLMRYKFRTQVTVRDLSAELLVLGDLAIPAEGARLGAVAGLPGLVASGLDPWPQVSPDGTAYTGELAEERHPGNAQQRRFTVVEAAAAGWLKQLGSGFAGSAQAGAQPTPGSRWRFLSGFLAWEALRVAAWQPTLAEVDERTIPHELDLLRSAVHLRKGCYCGQETVARVINLGRPPRRLVLLNLDGSEGVAAVPGQPILLDGKPCGVVTTSVSHYEEGPLALGLVKRAVPSSANFTVNSVAAGQTQIVTPEGRCGASPKERPGKGLRPRRR